MIGMRNAFLCLNFGRGSGLITKRRSKGFWKTGASSKEAISDRLVELLPADGTPRTNRELREALGLSDSEYWAARNSLLEQGVVTKLSGRGGRTALVPREQDSRPVEGRQWLRGTAFVLLILAAVVLAIAAWYLLFQRANTNWLWNGLGLVFGAATVAAAGVALLIFVVQEETARLEGGNQATLLRKLSLLTQRSVDYSSTVAAGFDELKTTMNEAVRADLASPELPTAEDASGQAGAPEGDEPAEGIKLSLLETEDGRYYRPGDVPLFVISDLVRWWQQGGQVGRWTVSRLSGGFRAWNKSRTTQGVPWVLTFQDEKGVSRSFRLSYSGAKKGKPRVSELSEKGGWNSPPDGI